VADSEVKRIIIGPEDIFTPQEIKVLELAAREALICPGATSCAALQADKVVVEGLYNGPAGAFKRKHTVSSR
jgi:hypothetical protein